MGRRRSSERTDRQRWLAVILARHDTNYADLAAGLGVSKTTLSRWAGGANAERVDELRIEQVAESLAPDYEETPEEQAERLTGATA